MEDPTVKILTNLAKQVGDRQDIMMEVVLYEDHAEVYILPLYDDSEDQEHMI